MKQQVATWQQEEIALENVTLHFHCDPQLPYSELVELIGLSQQAGIAQYTINTTGE